MTQRLKTTAQALVSIYLVLTLAGPLVSLAGVARAADKAVPPAATLTGITISFKLDPRLTRGLYMGDRWVSPPTYTRVGEGKELTVDARVWGLDAKKTPKNISPAWVPSDPNMVTVTPGQGNQVLITVKRAGKSSLTVTSGGAAKKLAIKAVRRNGGLRVDITQK